jgi:hypothetical protein
MTWLSLSTISHWNIHMSCEFTNLRWAAVVGSEGRLLVFLKMRMAEEIRLDLVSFTGGSLTGPVVLRK